MTGQSRTTRFRNRLYAGWKYFVSFFKSNWQLADYPVWVSEQEVPSGNEQARLKTPRFMASIVGWAGPTGTGETANAALAVLKASFESIRARRTLPRPGTGLPIEYAPQTRVMAQESLADEFIHRVLELDWAIITDESSLFDFHEENTNETLNAKIKEIYGIDVSDIQSGNLAEILERIAATRHS